MRNMNLVAGALFAALPLVSIAGCSASPDGEPAAEQNQGISFPIHVCPQFVIECLPPQERTCSPGSNGCPVCTCTTPPDPCVVGDVTLAGLPTTSTGSECCTAGGAGLCGPHTTGRVCSDTSGNGAHCEEQVTGTGAWENPCDFIAQTHQQLVATGSEVQATCCLAPACYNTEIPAVPQCKILNPYPETACFLVPFVPPPFTGVNLIGVSCAENTSAAPCPRQTPN
jgi:hypothetical protein